MAIFQDSVDEAELSGELWIYDMTRRIFNRLSTPGGAFEFVWSRDGQRLAHSSVAKDEFSIWERRTDGSGEAVKLYATPNPQIFALPEDWSPDEKSLAILQVDLSNGRGDVMILEPEAGGTTRIPIPYLNSPADEHAMRFSPDGKWVMFCSSESGRHELFVQRFTGAANSADDARSGRVQISTNGNSGAGWWSPDGKEIRYIDLDKQVMSVEVQTEPRLTASVPKILYSFKELKTRDYKWAPDGRVMAVVQGENERPNRIDLVVNFLDEVRAKLAAGK